MRTNDAQGSKWHRWDPHIHAPGTILNDQFGADPWEHFLTRIERSDPPIRALGITDYYSVETYEAVREWKRKGRLSDVDLIFPNIEMRYEIGTTRGSPVNVHLLVRPDDGNHVDEIKRFLRHFTYRFNQQDFRCDRNDLVALGRAHDPSLLDERSMLAAGTNQFKVNRDQLIKAWETEAWAQENILIAVSAGSGDGTAGLQSDASFASLRQEIERAAHIILSSQPKQRDFWLGRGGALTADAIIAKYGRCKPCLHGSDAHDVERVGAPALDRFCWIKGDVTFESIRQTCLEPEGRAFIGLVPPRGALPSQVITSISVTDASWLKTPTIPLNSGLVGIIGARGSGKTALADMIAAGAFALSGHLSDRSFIHRARPLLGNSKFNLTWEDGGPTSNSPDHIELEDLLDHQRVQYLSQQFVDTLCSSEGVTDELLGEVERVIYQAHPSEERLGTSTFRELLDMRVAHGRMMRERHEEQLAETTAELNVERERRSSLDTLKRQRKDRVGFIAQDKKDRSLLIRKGSEDRAARLDEVSSAADAVRQRIEQARRRRQSLVSLQADVANTRTIKEPARLRQLQQTYSEAGLSSEDWKAFLMGFAGNVDELLARHARTIDEQIRSLAGPAAGEAIEVKDKPSETPFIADGTVLTTQTLSLLDKEVRRLRAVIGIDVEHARAFSRLSEKISRDEAALARLDREIEVASKAEERIKELLVVRRDCYAKIFEGIFEEETELSLLYEPLRARLQAEEGALGKLSFSIRRTVDVKAWAEKGEALLDLRKTGPFRGKGTLLDAATEELLPAWERGSSAEVAESMARFRDAHEAALIAHAPVSRTDIAAFREWGGKISAWLYGTQHIRLTYGVQYDSLDIERLSQGTRGIVLLLLYLAIDREDDRPLIIDQPEENLDPKSVYDELVSRFRVARSRRQIIIVTHNANLIVNTDADQVVVATCGPHRPGELPEITYQSGGLENAEIRKQVCEILEGGEAAFKDRARRLRVKL